MVRYLVKDGVDIDIKDYDGLTALIHAARNGHEEVAYWLQDITRMGLVPVSTSTNLLVTQHQTVTTLIFRFCFLS